MFSANRRKSIVAAISLVSAATISAGVEAQQVVREPDAGLTRQGVAGLYQMVDPRGYADPMSAATYLRLLPDGRSRVEAVLVTDDGTSITAHTEAADFQRRPWELRATAAGPELCFAIGANLNCAQAERDPATGDLLLYDTARPRGHADLRLHRIGGGKMQARLP